MSTRYLVSACLLAALTPAPVLAQNDRSYWGVDASFTPSWTLTRLIKDGRVIDRATLPQVRVLTRANSSH